MFQKKHFVSADIQFFMPLIRSSNFRAFSDGKSKQRKGRARKAQDETRVSKNFSAARDCYEQALRIAITQGMAGLVTKLCHRLVEMHGRQADRSCCMLQASLCVPLCNHMQPLCSHMQPLCCKRQPLNNIRQPPSHDIGGRRQGPPPGRIAETNAGTRPLTGL